MRYMLPYQTFEQWKQYGLENKYDERNPSSLYKSRYKKEKYWYNKGAKKGWLNNFTFNKIKIMWKDKEEWINFGLENKYNEKNPSNLRFSKNREESSWYNKGRWKKWLKYFNFNRTEIRWKNQEEWIKFGLENKYSKRNPGSLYESKNKEGRSWYNKGIEKKWLKDFDFNRKALRGRWKNQEEWIKFGLENKYNEKNPRSFQLSKNKENRSWYNKGTREKWAKNFPFYKKFHRIFGKWENQKDWEKYGLEKKYNERNPLSLLNKKEERSWYKKGQREKWIRNFPFNRIINRWQIKTEFQLEEFLNENPTAKDLGTLASTEYELSDIAEVMVELWPERFPSASKLARSLPGAVKHIGHSLQPFSMGKVRRMYERTRGLPKKVQYKLDELLYNISVDQYQVKFNKDPEKTLEELKEETNKKNGFSELAERVLTYYKDIYYFNIPGFGKLDLYSIKNT